MIPPNQTRVLGTTPPRLRSRSRDLVEQRQLWALRLLPVAAAVGGQFFTITIMGGNLFLFRILVLGLLFVTLGTNATWRTNRTARSFLVLALAWTAWSAVSLVWTPDVDGGLQETLAIAFGLLVGLVMFNLALERESNLDALLQGWMIAYFLAGVVAVREIMTGVYLPGTVADRFGENAIDGLAISFFGNPNNYGAFILLSVPFMLLGFSRARTRLMRYAALVLLGSAPVLVFFSTSRLGLIGLLVQYVAFALFGLQTPRQLLKYLAFGGAIVFLVGSVFWSGSRTATDVERLLRQDYVSGPLSQSDQLRWNLTRNGIWMTLNSGGVGVGAAGYATVTAEEDVPYFVRNLVDPHNFWIEVMSQHGMIIFFALAIWLIRLGRTATRVRRMTKYGFDPVRYGVAVTILVGLSGYLFASVANSSFISQSTNWVFLASMAALGASIESEGTIVRRARLYRWKGIR